MRVILYFFCILFFLDIGTGFSQNTVGLIAHRSSQAYEGYNLVFPHNQSTVFLINNCGEIVHQWLDDAPVVPGNTAYLIDNGNLVKAKRLQTSAVNDPIWAGGGGETVEVRTWDNTLMASFTLNNEQFRLHHDIAPLPNGNILMIAWENKTGEEADLAGRDTSLLTQGKVWSERIIEWNPTTDEIVWEWSVWDHLVQDFDGRKQNFGAIKAHPELIDVNYDTRNGHPDWLHINAIDYNERLNQILLSVPAFDELWIIDHSTTTEEASGHTGGQSGKGGDLLYRWGNPAAYQGTGERQLFFQHDAQWIDDFLAPDAPYYNDILVFNNRVAENYSTVNILRPSYNEEMRQYEMGPDTSFLPQNSLLTLTHPDTFSLYSAGLSSAQVLPNQNILTIAGRTGHAFEINPITNEVIWEYRVPLENGSPVAQGTILENNDNLTFRIRRYPMDFPAFTGKDISPKGYWELVPDTEFCGTLSVSTADILTTTNSLKVYPNPTKDFLMVENTIQSIQQATIYNSLGQVLIVKEGNGATLEIDIHHLENGIYFLQVDHFLLRKIVKY